MAPLHRVIIDTDPGVDDILAMLLALAAKPEEIELLLLSVTYGNVDVQSCVKNVITLFHVIEKELEWRKAQGQLEGFDTMKTFKPLVAVGADHPLDAEIVTADYFHGIDGLGGVHTSHPHLSPSNTWKTLFERRATSPAMAETIRVRNSPPSLRLFNTSLTPAHVEILRLLHENPQDTITIVAMGPLTNLALAAAEDPETFLKVKEVVVMGGAIESKGNVTPVAEFNTYADAVAMARVFALTSPTPTSTMPPPTAKSSLPPYPAKLSRQLKLTLFPLDITNQHLLKKSLFDDKVIPLVKAGSPLAEWVFGFMGKTFDTINSIEGIQLDPGLSLHDPMTIWYMLSRGSPAWKGSPKGLEDIRIETVGQWTRGMHVIDRRNRFKVGKNTGKLQVRSAGTASPMQSLPISETEDLASDKHSWLIASKGNKINRIVSSPGQDVFGKYLLERIFGEI